MPIKLTTMKAVEKSTFVLQCDFTDENGQEVAPATLIWTLTDAAGTVINSRADVNVADPESTEYIVLTGDDLQIFGTDEQEARLVTIEATYDSDLGTGLHLKESAEFAVEQLIAVD